MRLLTAPRSARLQSLHRALRLLDSKGLGVKWTQAESKRVLDFIGESDERAQRSATKWASDFFAKRGKTEKGTDTATTTDDTNNSTNQD